MEDEIKQTPHIITEQLKKNKPILMKLKNKLKKNPPSFILTVARGSSNCAALFAKYLFETKMGIITASCAPSVITMYNSKLKLKNSLVLAISQSGASPDICEMMRFAKKQKAITVAILNETDSPLGKIADFVIPMHAKKEKATAATKSFLASLAILLHLTALLTNDTKLLNCLYKLPHYIIKTLKEDWTEAVDTLKKEKSVYVIGRGYNFPIAMEAALKLKEVANIHAEAFSAAEFMHGPISIIKDHFPIILFSQKKPLFQSINKIINTIKGMHGKTILILPQDLIKNAKADILLKTPPSLHILCDPLIIIAAFYHMTVQLAIEKKLNPDHPKNLKKITKTK
jgi:glucosamine--fructose-6-phosphate aminotransferase (isomerizing)